MIKEINLITPINLLSYGYIGQNLVKAFINKGVKVNLVPLGPIEIDAKAGYDKYIKRCNDKLHIGSPTLIIWHHHDLKKFEKIPGSVRIGFPIFETDTFSPLELENLNSVDILFTTCQWFKDILLRHKVSPPVYIVPLGVDPEIFKPTPAKGNDKVSNIVKFLHIGKWEIRKGYIELIKAFGEEFKDTEGVSLTLCCNNPFIGEENIYWANYAKKHINSSQLNIIDSRFTSCIEMSELINKHQVYLAPCKSEGFNLPLLENMFCNKLCIATNNSGHTAFCNNNNCLLVETPDKETMFDGQWFFGQGRWSKIDITELRKSMRLAFDMISNNKITETSITIYESVKHLTWENSVNKILEVF